MAITGEEIVYARAPGATWGLAAACGAGHGFLGLPAGADPSYDDQEDDSLGSLFALESTPGSIKLDTSLPFYLRYNCPVGIRMLAEFMGTAGVPVTHPAGTDDDTCATAITSAQVATAAVGGTFDVDDIFTITLGGVPFAHTVIGGNTNAAGIATALAALVDAHADYVATATDNVVTITKATAGSFTIATTATNAAGGTDDQTLVAAITSAQVATATLSGTFDVGDVYTVTLDGVAYAYTVPSNVYTMNQVAAAIATLIDASAGYTASAVDLVITITKATAGAFTISATATNVAVGVLAKNHTFKIAKKTDGLFGTFLANLGAVFLEEVPSQKVAKIVITGETGKPLRVDASGPGFDLITDSQINTLLTAAGITILEKKGRAYNSQVLFTMNDASAGALNGATDKLKYSKFVLTAERKLTGQYGSHVSSNRDCIDEPTNDGQFTATLSVTIPRTDNATGRAKIRANTSQKAEITCIGPIIEGQIPYLFKLQFPNLVPKDYKNPHKQGNIENTREYRVLGTDTAPTGMPGNTDPFWMMFTNKIATDPLA